ncbi:hypothetical protein NDU88_002683 [Pleurodeles waltl]|uniref:Uncharacterized protein n=1 Tax=Pleurodeles waltl TaxID=8319 RepID=A0AAV7NG46_PLEWA|nr:hypothetical protein NDU88_002683 [Pleurodeles waltl]
MRTDNASILPMLQGLCFDFWCAVLDPHCNAGSFDAQGQCMEILGMQDEVTGAASIRCGDVLEFLSHGRRCVNSSRMKLGSVVPALRCIDPVWLCVKVPVARQALSRSPLGEPGCVVPVRRCGDPFTAWQAVRRFG